jgi:hypothetical protein
LKSTASAGAWVASTPPSVQHSSDMCSEVIALGDSLKAIATS